MSSTLPQSDDFMSAPVFEIEKALKRVHQKKDLLARVIDIYVNSLSERVDTIKNELVNENWEALGTLVHSIKGSSWTIGAQQLGDIAFAMEKAAADKDMTLFHHLFQIFQASVQRFFEVEKKL